MDELTIRRVVDGDHEEWLRMRIALWPGCAAESAEWLRREMLKIFSRPEQSPVFVAVRADGRLGGVLEANLRTTAQGCATSPVAYVEGWYVDEDLRRTGVGRQLVAAAEEWAMSIGCKELASDCPLENEASFQAHRALGFAEEGRLIHFRKLLKDKRGSEGFYERSPLARG